MAMITPFSTTSCNPPSIAHVCLITQHLQGPLHPHSPCLQLSPFDPGLPRCMVPAGWLSSCRPGLSSLQGPRSGSLAALETVLHMYRGGGQSPCPFKTAGEHL